MKVTDSNSGLNYNYTYSAANVGTITAAPLTIAAQSNSKLYNGSTNAAATPLASGLQGSDTVTGAVESYTNKNVGTGNTLVVTSYTVNDGNSGNNYSVTLVSTNTGVISVTNLTVTAVASTKLYDGTTNSSGTPTLSTALQVGDTTNALSQAYTSRNVGTANRTLHPAITIGDGNSGANYNVTLTDFTTGTISVTNIAITAQANTKVYDGLTNSATAAAITVGGIQTGDSAPTWAQYYNSATVGTTKAITPDGTLKVSDVTLALTTIIPLRQLMSVPSRRQAQVSLAWQVIQTFMELRV